MSSLQRLASKLLSERQRVFILSLCQWTKENSEWFLFSNTLATVGAFVLYHILFVVLSSIPVFFCHFFLVFHFVLQSVISWSCILINLFVLFSRASSCLCVFILCCDSVLLPWSVSPVSSITPVFDFPVCIKFPCFQLPLAVRCMYLMGLVCLSVFLRLSFSLWILLKYFGV